MKKVFIPSAILAECKAAGFDGSDYFRNARLLDILSPEDVAFYYYVNLQSSQFLPTEIDLSFSNYLLSKDSQNGAPWDQIEDERVRKEVGRLINDYCLKNDAPQSANLSREISSELLFIEGESDPLLLFTDIEDSSTECQTEVERLRALYMRVMMQVTQFQPIAKLAKLPVFEGYLRSSASALQSA